jgi:hypothetical protein
LRFLIDRIELVSVPYDSNKHWVLAWRRKDEQRIVSTILITLKLPEEFLNALYGPIIWNDEVGNNNWSNDKWGSWWNIITNSWLTNNDWYEGGVSQNEFSDWLISMLKYDYLSRYEQGSELLTKKIATPLKKWIPQ